MWIKGTIYLNDWTLRLIIIHGKFKQSPWILFWVLLVPSMESILEPKCLVFRNLTTKVRAKSTYRITKELQKPDFIVELAKLLDLFPFIIKGSAIVFFKIFCVQKLCWNVPISSVCHALVSPRNEKHLSSLLPNCNSFCLMSIQIYCYCTA